MDNPAQSIVQILVNKKVISPEIAERIKIDSLNTGLPQEEIISRKKLASEKDVLQAKAELLDIPYVSLPAIGFAPEVLSLIPEVVARRYHAIPFDYDPKEEVLKVAMVDPLDLQVIEFLERKTKKKIQAFLAVSSEIEKAINEEYARGLTEEVKSAVAETAVPQIKTIEAREIGEIIREAPIAKIVSTVLEYAVHSRSSDIHIEPQEQKSRVRYRIDGILHEKLALPKGIHEALVSRIKILSDLKIDEKRVPQDGRFNFKIGPEEVDLRISTLPTVYGEKVVMRLLKKTGGVPDLADLGLRGLALKNLEFAISRPHGIILVTGPTGSGKTTTLYSVLSRLNTTKVNIVTLEDPVEYQIAGVNQVQINPAAGLTFATGLRSFLRQDPNIILVGEIRDKETTGLAIQAALTGHLVFSTLHTNDAATAIPRLLDMGAEPFLVASSLNCVVGQRISRRICPSCKEEYQPPSEVEQDVKAALGKLLDVNKKITLFRGKGCSECNNTGYFGRVGIFEVLPVSSQLAKMILERTSSADIAKQAISEGMITLKQDGYLKAIEGITSLEEVLRVAQD